LEKIACNGVWQQFGINNEDPQQATLHLQALPAVLVSATDKRGSSSPLFAPNYGPGFAALPPDVSRLCRPM